MKGKSGPKNKKLRLESRSPKTQVAPVQPRPRPERPPRPAANTEAEVLELDIEKVVAGGLGLSRTVQGVVLVPGVLGGERVLARVHQARGVRQGELLQVLRPSPERVSHPELPTADLAHASYPEQLRIKRQLVQEALTRIARLEFEVEQTVPSPRQWAYRNGAQYLITPQGLAYRQRRGHQPWLLPISQGQASDPLVMEAVQAVLGRLDPLLLAPGREVAFRGSLHSGEVVAALIGEGEPRQYLRAANHLLDAGVSGVTLAQSAGRRFTAGVKLITGERETLEQLGDVLVGLSASGFAQINPQAAGEAYRLAVQLAKGSVTDKGARAVDLYGGSGAIARHLAPHFAEVVVIDTAGEALKRGQADVRRGGESNVRFVHGDARLLPECEVMVVDPPRAGLDGDTREILAQSAAHTLVYVSCDPATWARDVGALSREGWALRRAVPHDFYPQTSHIEVVSLLERP